MASFDLSDDAKIDFPNGPPLGFRLILLIIRGFINLPRRRTAKSHLIMRKHLSSKAKVLGCFIGRNLLILNK